MRVSGNHGRVPVLLGLGLLAATLGWPQSTAAPAVAVNPPAVAVAPGSASPPVLLTVTLPSPARAAQTLTFDVDVPAALRAFVQAEPSQIAVTIAPRGQTGAARFRLRVAPGAPPGTYRVPVRDARGRLAAAVGLTVTPPSDTRVPPAPSPTEARGGQLQLELQPSSLLLCDGGEAVPVVATLTPSRTYRGRPRLRWKPLPAGITVAPPVADVPGLPPPQSQSFRVSARGAAAGRHLLALEAAEAGQGVVATAAVTAEVVKPDFTPVATPAAPVVRQGGSPLLLALSIQGNRCFAARSVSVSLSGAPAGLSLTPSAATLVGPGFTPAGFQLQAAPSLAMGDYRLTATFADRAGTSRRLDILLKVEASGRGEPPGREAPGRSEVPSRGDALRAPRIDQVQPAKVEPGKRYTLEMSGQNLDAGTTVSFGTGIELLGPPVFHSPTSAAVEVLVTPGAAPGVRAASARSKAGASKGPGGVLVESLPPPPLQATPVLAVSPATPRVDEVQPAVLERGKTYLLKLTGQNLQAAQEYAFGGGIAVAAGSVTPISPTQVAVKAQVANDAPAGKRWAIAYGSAGSTQGPGSVAVATPKPPPPPPPVLQQAPPVDVLAKVYLDAPKLVTYPIGIDPGAPTEYHVPKLDDEVKLEWHEQNPGTAHYFEVRFLDPSGAKVLAKERIDLLGIPWKGKVLKILPTFFRPSASLVAQLATLAPKTGGLVVAQGPIAGVPGAPPPAGPKPGQTPALAVGSRDFLWEVAGYQLATATGGGGNAMPIADAGKKPQGFLVEISERWPLALAGKPTGLTCPAGGSVHGKFGLENITGEASAAVLTGDALSLDGTFDFALSPYALHPVGIKTPVEEALDKIGQAQKQLNKANPFGGGGGSGGGSPIATHSRWKFDTVFVDWGDGTAEPLVADGASASISFSPGMALHLPTGQRTQCGPGVPYVHCYDNPGSYTVRIYQLPGDAAQKVDPASVASAKDGMAKASFSPVMTAVGQGGSVPGSGGASVAKAAGDMAYMLFCRTVSVLPPPDTCAEGPLQLAQIEITGFPGHEKPTGKPGEVMAQPVIPGGSSTKPPTYDGVATTCDTFLTAQARLHYVGKGIARVRWRWEDGTVLKEEILTLQSPPSGGGGPTLDSRDDIYSPVLPVSDLGVHGLTVEAEVLHDPLGALAQAAAGGGAAPDPLCSIAKNWSAVSTLDEICKKEPLFCPGAKSGSTVSSGGLEVGLFLPAALAGAAGVGKGGVQPLGNVPALASGASLSPKPSGKKDVPEFVQSSQVHYKVFNPDPQHPCFFLFPTQKGDFIVADTNMSVKPEGAGVYSGNGILKFPLSQGGSVEYFPVKTKIAHWAAPDGVHVTQGQIHETPALGLHAPASEVKLGDVQGTAGALLAAQLGVSPVSKLLIDPGAKGAPKWTAKAPLSSQGDWIASSLTTPRLAIGYSAFELAPWNDVTVDFSTVEGKAPASETCGSGGTAFTGIHLGKAPLSIYQFDISQQGVSPLRDLDGWVISDQGLCGAATVAGLPKLGLGDGGWIQSGPLAVSAAGGGFSATFQGLQVFSPWFSQPGAKPLGPVDAVFYDSAGPDEKYFKVPGLGSPPPQDWGTVALKASDLELVRSEGLGWALSGDFALSFEDHAQKPFAAFATSSLAIDLGSGLARFLGGKVQDTVPLGASSGPAPHLGDTPLLLQAVNVSGQSSGERRLLFDFDGTLKLSQANTVLPDAPAHVLFEVRRQGSGYTAPSPSTPSFAVKASFPPGKSPTSEADLNLQYVPGSTFYCGQFDLALLGGTGMGAGTGTFVLGYDGKGKDGWLAHYEVPLAGGAGIPIAPPLPINLFSIDGGLGYNIDGKAFSDPLTCKTPFQIKDTGVLFSAGMRAGTSDRATLTVDGQLTIDPGATTRFDVDAWLLDSNPSGKGDIEGVLKWTDGAFRGKFWGGFQFVEDPTGLFGGHAVDLSLGSGEGNAAVDLLVSKSGEWHVWAGQNPKYKGGATVSGRVLFAKSDVWLMVGGQGLSGLDLDVGGQQKLEVGGCIWECCAKAYAEFGCSIDMHLNPLGVKGSAHASFGVKLCGVGFSIGGKAGLGCCPPSAHVQLCADVVPCLDPYPTLCEACAGFDL